MGVPHIYVIINRTATSLHIVCNFLLFSYRCLRHNTSHPNYTYINKFALQWITGRRRGGITGSGQTDYTSCVCVKALSLFPLQWRRHYEKKHRCVEEMDDQQQPAPSRVRSRRNDAKSKKQLFGKKKKSSLHLHVRLCTPGSSCGSQCEGLNSWPSEAEWSTPPVLSTP